MNQNNIITFDQAKKLVDLNFKFKIDDDYPFVWSQNKNCKELVVPSHVSSRPQLYCTEGRSYWDEYPAYLLSEILEHLPFEIENEDVTYYLTIQKLKITYHISYTNLDISLPYRVFRNENLTWAAADLLIWCIENNYYEQ